MQQPMQNPEDISDPTTAIDMALVLMAKEFKLNNTTPTNNNQRRSSNPCNRQIAQPGMNMSHDRQMLMVEDNIARKEEARIQLNYEEFDFIAVAGTYDESEEVNANCTLKDNLQQASSPGTQTDSALVYDSDGSVEVHHSKNCYDNDIFNLFTQEEQYTELLKPITEPHTVQQSNSNVISVESSVEHNGGTIEQHPATVEETRAYFESLYNNLVIKVDKVNLSVYQEKCLTKKINALHLNSAKMITTLNEEIANLNNHLSKENSTVSYLQREKKKLKSDFKTREDELLDKQIQLENKIKELDNILVKQQAQQKQQSLYNGKVLLEKHDPPVVYDSEETLQLAQESRLKMKQLNIEIKPANYAKINQISKVFVSQKAKSREELYFSNTSKTASISKSVSKSISIPNEEFSDDTSPSVARKFLNEVKGTTVTLQYTSNLQTEFDRMKEKLKTCIIKKEKEYVVVWNNWYKKCEECKYDKISYDKAYNDMQNQIDRLQAQLGAIKGKSSNIQSASNTLDPLSQKLEDENVSLEFQVLNYAKEN
ncbi:hypothetical protein Tco_0437958 [Tanacetum coccineum]